MHGSGGLPHWAADEPCTLAAVSLHFGLALRNALLLRQGRQVPRLYRVESLATVGPVAAVAAHEIATGALFVRRVRIRSGANQLLRRRDLTVVAD